MLPLALFALLVIAVAVLARRGRGHPPPVRMCCSARPWPPEDLTGAAPQSDVTARPAEPPR